MRTSPLGSATMCSACTPSIASPLRAVPRCPTRRFVAATFQKRASSKWVGGGWGVVVGWWWWGWGGLKAHLSWANVSHSVDSTASPACPHRASTTWLTGTPLDLLHGRGEQDTRSRVEERGRGSRACLDVLPVRQGWPAKRGQGDMTHSFGDWRSPRAPRPPPPPLRSKQPARTCRPPPAPQPAACPQTRAGSAAGVRSE